MFQTRAPSAKRGKPPCKYGPRVNGRCPKKPAGARASSGGRPCKYGPRGADGYCPKKPSSGRSSSGSTGPTAPAARRETPAQAQRRADDIAASAIDVATAAVPLVPALRRLATSRVTRTGAGALTLGGVVGLAAAAGLAAFAGTTAILHRIRDAKERKAKEQFLAAQGYRVARADLEHRLGRAPTRPEHDLLAAVWRDKLPQVRK